MIGLSKARRAELRQYKAKDGLTYDEAIHELLERAGWYGRDETEERLVHMLKAANEIGAKTEDEEIRELAQYLSRGISQMREEKDA